MSYQQRGHRLRPRARSHHSAHATAPTPRATNPHPAPHHTQSLHAGTPLISSRYFPSINSPTDTSIVPLQYAVAAPSSSATR
jgi:hypothetical protein